MLYRLLSISALRLGVIGERGLFVSEAIHRSVVDVNEEGTEAAAATAAVFMLECGPADPPPQLICDHPVYTCSY